MVNTGHYLCDKCGSPRLAFVKKENRGKENKKWYCLSCKKRVFVKSVVR